MGGGQRALLLGGALAGVALVVIVISVAVWSGATLQTDPTALAQVNLQPLGRSPRAGDGVRTRRARRSPSRFAAVA